MSKVYDAFLFFNELDLLEIRLNVLDPYVDYFIISECDYTFSGNPKPFYYEENKERFKKFQNKIIHVKTQDTDKVNFPLKFTNKKEQDLYEQIKLDYERNNARGATPHDHWRREFQQREMTRFGMLNIDDQDIVINSDVDEIPNPNSLLEIKKWCEPNKIYGLRQKVYNYYLNLYNPTEDNWWGPKICRYGKMKNESINELRCIKDELVNSVWDGGWHFTSIGGIDAIRKKIESWGHQEYNNHFIKENIEQRVKEGKDIFFRSETKYIPLPIDESMPRYVVDNREKFSDLIMEI
jgi:beta-1,4-mannosyl-glycoprotein beta-1,4-N-acetylglucosaminyltransferase